MKRHAAYKVVYLHDGKVVTVEGLTWVSAGDLFSVPEFLILTVTLMI